MDLFETFNEVDTVFTLFSRRLSTTKLHELLNKIFEFVAQLKEEDLCENNVKQLTVKKELKKNGAPNFHLNYNVDSHLINTQIIPEDSANKEVDFPSPEKKIKLDCNSGVVKKKEEHHGRPLDQKERFIINNQNTDLEVVVKKAQDNPFLATEKSNLFSTVIIQDQPVNVESPSQSQGEEKGLDPYETPKFANETLFSTSSAILELAPKLRENIQKNHRKRATNSLSEKLTKDKPWPEVLSSYKPLPSVDFDLELYKPGTLSEELMLALDMSSNKDPPPYLPKLLKVGIPNYYHEEIFYGINSKVPSSYNLRSWREAGVDPFYLEGEPKEVNSIQDENINKSKIKPRDEITDDTYLRRYLRKPVTIYKNNEDLAEQGERSKKDTIEID